MKLLPQFWICYTFFIEVIKIQDTGIFFGGGGALGRLPEKKNGIFKIEVSTNFLRAFSE